MTGNSLDGADLVLTRFGRDDGAMVDLATHSVPFPEDLKDDLRAVRAAVNAAEGWVDQAVADLGSAAFDRTLGRYTTLLAGAVADLRGLAGADVDLIGLHGQTCAHRPPSIAGAGGAYTVQLGDGQGLADRTGITVVDDFRSDDLMAGGEGAPLAPMHHRHLAEVARARGRFPIAFCNGGNTGNVSVISVDSATRRARHPRLGHRPIQPLTRPPDAARSRSAVRPRRRGRPPGDDQPRPPGAPVSHRRHHRRRRQLPPPPAPQVVRPRVVPPPARTARPVPRSPAASSPSRTASGLPPPSRPTPSPTPSP